jgi:hypothetical protein
MATATLGRVDLSGIGKKQEKTKTAYPVFDVPRAKELAALILKGTQEMEAIEANVTINKADLRSLAVPAFFERMHGRTEIPSSFSVPSEEGEVLVTFTSKYKQPTDLAALTVLMGEKAEKFLKPSFKLEIDSSKIPQADQQEVVNALVTLLATFDCADALSASEYTSPTEDFHSARHTAFTPEQNMAIENIMPMTAQVKTKGRK